MQFLIIGNILCFAGSIIMTLMGFIKHRERFLSAQCVMNAFFIAGNIFLGGITGAIANFVTLIRNVVCLKWNMNKWMKALFIIFQIVLAAFAGSTSIIMWLPIIGACVFTWVMDTDNIVLLKWVIIITQIMWGIYDVVIKNYATVPFDIATTVTNFISLIVILKNKKMNAIKEE
jgi:hypothetical protein